MLVKKEIRDDNEFYLYFDGKLIFKKWLNQGYSKVFDHMAWGKYTDRSITDFDLDETPNQITVKAKLKLLLTEEGGRSNGIISGYRPNHVFEYQENGQFEYAFMGEIQFDKEWIMPGEEKEVSVRFLSQQPIEVYLSIGAKWWIHEGSKCIGEAEMLEILID